MSQHLIRQIIEGAGDYEDGTLGADRCIEFYCDEHGIDDETMLKAQKHFHREEALRAGIPLSVIEGKTKLRDHFSQEYIDSQAYPKGKPERGDVA